MRPTSPSRERGWMGAIMLWQGSHNAQTIAVITFPRHPPRPAAGTVSRIAFRCFGPPVPAPLQAGGCNTRRWTYRVNPAHQRYDVPVQITDWTTVPSLVTGFRTHALQTSFVRSDS